MASYDDKIIDGKGLHYFLDKIKSYTATTSSVGLVKPDGESITITADGTISASAGGADWNATSGQSGFIANKPFDVSTSSQITIFNNVSCEPDAESGYYAYNNRPETAAVTLDDVGSTFSITYNGNTYQTLIESVSLGDVDTPAFGYNWDWEELEPASEDRPAIAGYFMDDGEGYLAEYLIIYESTIGETPISVNATISKTVTTKLSASKINVDGTTITNDNGALTANYKDALIVNVTGSSSYTKDKTYSQIASAYNNGQQVKLIYKTSSSSTASQIFELVSLQDAYAIFSNTGLSTIDSFIFNFVEQFIITSSDTVVHWDAKTNQWASSSDFGIVKPDNSTITISDGVISAVGGTGAVESVNGKTGVVVLSASDIGLGNVENKSSATIRGELTSANVTTALGYTPPTTNTTYSAGTGLSLNGTTFSINSIVVTTSDTQTILNKTIDCGTY